MKKKLATHFLAPLLSGIHYEYIDLGIAGEHFVLAAEERGLGTCWVGWIKAARAKKILDLPFDVTPVSFLSVPPTANSPPMILLRKSCIISSVRMKNVSFG